MKQKKLLPCQPIIFLTLALVPEVVEIYLRRDARVKLSSSSKGMNETYTYNLKQSFIKLKNNPKS